MKQLYRELISLLSCTANGIVPDKACLQDTDMEQLYRLALFHSVRAAVCIALERAGVHDAQFHQAYKKAIRKNIYHDMERAAITAEFDRQGIWYMPLKGSVLKELYPENGMREMADNDLLYDAAKQAQVREIMLKNGYIAESVGKSNHDVYHKEPVLNFELHTALFGTWHEKPLYAYYADTERLLKPDADGGCGRHFSDEDFYVYMTAHEWKHYSGSGTGIRSLMDCYVYCKCKGDALNWDYIAEQCRLLEIEDFERERRLLAQKVFSAQVLPELSEAETGMLLSYLEAGTYGTLKNRMYKKLQKQSKASYILRNLFPDLGYMMRSVEFVGKYPVLYPAGIVYRWGRILVKRRKHLAAQMKAMRNFQQKK